LQVSKIISRKDLMILLNEIYLSKKKMLNVKFPFYHLNLFSVDVEGYEIDNIVTEKEFNKAREKHMPESDFLKGIGYESCIPKILFKILPFNRKRGG